MNRSPSRRPSPARRAAGEARAPARARESSRSRTPSRTGPRSRRSGSPTRTSRPGTETSDRYRVAGRLIARRGHGKASFLDLRDGTGQIQIQARVDELGEAYERSALTGHRRHRRDRGDRLRLEEGGAFDPRRRLGAALEEPSPAARRSSTASRTSRPATAGASST